MKKELGRVITKIKQFTSSFSLFNYVLFNVMHHILHVVCTLRNFSTDCCLYLTHYTAKNWFIFKSECFAQTKKPCTLLHTSWETLAHCLEMNPSFQTWETSCSWSVYKILEVHDLETDYVFAVLAICTTRALQYALTIAQTCIAVRMSVDAGGGKRLNHLKWPKALKKSKKQD